MIRKQKTPSTYRIFCVNGSIVKRVHPFSEWTSELSGCYRPEYFSKLTAEGAENNVVTDINPVVVMASNKTSNGVVEYEAGIQRP